MAMIFPDAEGAAATGSDLAPLRIAVVGAGHVGAELIRNLALMGVGRIDVYESDDAKADPLRGRCTVFFGDFWDELTLARLQAYDFAICTVEDRSARVRLNQKCLVANVNLLQAWTEGSRAIVDAYPFGVLSDCACFECDPKHRSTPVPLAALKLSVVAPHAGIAVGSIAGALAAALLARVAAGAHGMVARRATLEATLGHGMSVELVRDPECTRCRSLERPVPIVQTRNRWAPSSSVTATCPDVLEQDVRLSDDIAGFSGGSCRVGELVTRFEGGPVPAKFALTEVGGRTICLDFEDAPAPRELGADGRRHGSRLDREA